MLPSVSKNTISVITICFNNLQDLIETCLSVDGQANLPDEHLVIDGSTDDKIISWLTNTTQPKHRKWIHERDNGISDAMNKGINKSSSAIIHILHSGDKYYTVEAIGIVKTAFAEDESIMWTHSKYVQHRGNVNVVSGAIFEKTLLWKGMRTVAHPTMFIKRELYNKYGLYNEDYKIAMDFDFLVRIRNEKFIFIPKPLIYFAPGGTSNLHFKLGLTEVRKIYKIHIGKNIKLHFWQWRQILLNNFIQTSLGKFLFRLKNIKQIQPNKDAIFLV